MAESAIGSTFAVLAPPDLGQERGLGKRAAARRRPASGGAGRAHVLYKQACASMRHAGPAPVFKICHGWARKSADLRMRGKR